MPAVDDLRNLAQRVEIAGREQIARVGQRFECAVDQQFVRQAAGLRALAAIGAAASPGFRRKALAGVGYAQRAVDEDFQIAIGFLARWREFRRATARARASRG